MTNKEIKIKSEITHAIFTCKDCNWECEDFGTARKKAYQHSKATGHSTRGEVGRYYHYN